METKSRIARWPMILGLGILAAVSMGNEGGGCVEPFPLDETACDVASQCEGLPHIDCVGDWQCEVGQCVFQCGAVEDECAVPADCEGLPHVACVGAWDCLQGRCAWECSNESPVGCQGDQDCQVGFHCEYQRGCPPCECGPDYPNCDCPMCMPPQFGECVPDSHCCEDKDGDYFCVQVDCDDLDPAVNPLAPEVCDGRDNNCDGLIDEDCGTGRKCMDDTECYEGETCRFDGPYGPDGSMMCCLPDEMCLMYLPVCVGECALLPGRCWSDADCGPARTCEGAIVCPPGAYCFAADRPGECVDILPPAKCASDDDCPEGQICGERTFCPDCVYMDPACAAPCAVETVCIDICRTDADCPPGEYCDILRCGDQWCPGPYVCTLYLPD